MWVRRVNGGEVCGSANAQGSTATGGARKPREIGLSRDYATPQLPAGKWWCLSTVDAKLEMEMKSRSPAVGDSRPSISI